MNTISNILNLIVQEKVFKADQVDQVNPPKFDACVDMANLT